jgi:hypothetical protein
VSARKERQVHGHWTRTKQYKRNRIGARIRSRKGIRHKAKREKRKVKVKKTQRQKEVNLR